MFLGQVMLYTTGFPVRLCCIGQVVSRLYRSGNVSKAGYVPDQVMFMLYRIGYAPRLGLGMQKQRNKKKAIHVFLIEKKM